ncbi:putative leucine-rich repeat receptor-like protein kinase At2g19210 [Neltuma alba]|uniref:putative leucine-rich repeat receptor-like protein kinase At2g19210 n=1 Tax=Neltuma alba TaxID=207710 RepID=UPI0010A44DFB|nr:putative leucine-rich repeat receptor-like protein kinase At2g19210 [Prosopis alba]
MCSSRSKAEVDLKNKDEDLSIAIGKGSKKEDEDLKIEMSFHRSTLNFASFHLHYHRKNEGEGDVDIVVYVRLRSGKNYDNKNQFPKFDVYLGVNFWTTIELGAKNFAYVEVTIQEVTNDMVHKWKGDTYDRLWRMDDDSDWDLPSGQKRIINITFDDDDENSLSQELTLKYLKAVTLISSNVTTTNVSFTVRARVDSSAPPILNAFEIFKVFPEPNSPTDIQDVNAFMEIKRTYGISKISWQGDPCLPSKFAREVVRCNSGSNTRIVAFDGTGNKLAGSIPKALRENASLQLSVANNPGLCELDSCDKERSKFVIPLVTSIAVFVLIAILSLIIWRFMRKKIQGGLSSKSLKMEILKQKGREFSYLQVIRITDNFKTFIGEGDFMKVHLVTLENDSEVAVKVLSPSSKQGYMELQLEIPLKSRLLWF